MRKYTFIAVIEAICYVVKTGCQWNMIPNDFPHWKTAYHHFRSLSARGYFRTLLRTLVGGRRAAEGYDPRPGEGIVDSQSVKWGICHSVKGVDGHKRVKGIKRHLCVDELGYPLEVYVTGANENDSRSAIPLVGRVLVTHTDIEMFKADKGYRGPLVEALAQSSDTWVECVKSNLGTPDFVPMDGRWVVERTFSWMDSYRRLARNYEKHLHVAEHMFIVGAVMFMLRYFR